MNNIYELISSINDSTPIIGEGTYSLVFGVGNNKVNKITSEYNGASVDKITSKTNKLYNAGVNVPQINSVYVFKAETGAVIQNIKSILRNSGEQKYEVLADYAKGFTNNQGKYEIVCMQQDKIEGTNCFVDTNNIFINLVNKRVQNTSNLTSELKRRLEAELNKNLDYFCAIPTGHYTKFFNDGKAVLKENLNIDNILKTNFMYNSTKGFYYIDLGGLEDTNILGEQNLFNFTVENICQMVYANTPCLSVNVAEKQLELCVKLKEAINNASKDNFIQKQYAEYSSGDNVFNKLQANALNILTKDNETLAEKYYNLLKNTGSSQAEKQ